MAWAVALVVAGALALAACGGGGGGSSSGPITGSPPSTPPKPPLLLQKPSVALQAPIIDLGNSLHVGPDVAPPRGALNRGLKHRGITTSSGTVSDGIGRTRLVQYLRDEAAQVSSPGYEDGWLARFDNPPTVHIAAGATATQISETVRAVQIINASLPYNWQMRVSPVSASAAQEHAAEGQILVRFLPTREWPDRFISTNEGGCNLSSWGCASHHWSAVDPFMIGRAEVLIDPQKVDGTLIVITAVHELLHALGRKHADPNRYPRSIMVAHLAAPPSRHILSPLDREALLAAYGWLRDFTRGNAIYASFGEWGSTSGHIRGDIDAVPGAAFGVKDTGNGLSQPWARGPKPDTNLAANPVLSSTASWSGMLLGYGLGSVVAGNADLSIGLATLNGDLDFTDLRATKNGSTSVWGDGDLAYTVDVRGNTFVQTGGDAGLVTGIFVGAAHEGMAGTLQRDDLAAAFGGTRE